MPLICVIKKYFEKQLSMVLCTTLKAIKTSVLILFSGLLPVVTAANRRFAHVNFEETSHTLCVNLILAFYCTGETCKLRGNTPVGPGEGRLAGSCLTCVGGEKCLCLPENQYVLWSFLSELHYCICVHSFLKKKRSKQNFCS